MRKVMTTTLEFETEKDRDQVLNAIDTTMVKQKNTFAFVQVHDCYHDEGKPCLNLEVIYDNRNKPSELDTVKPPSSIRTS